MILEVFSSVSKRLAEGGCRGFQESFKGVSNGAMLLSGLQENWRNSRGFKECPRRFKKKFSQSQVGFRQVSMRFRDFQGSLGGSRRIQETSDVLQRVSEGSRSEVFQGIYPFGPDCFAPAVASNTLDMAGFITGVMHDPSGPEVFSKRFTALGRIHVTCYNRLTHLKFQNRLWVLSHWFILTQ